MQHDGKFTLAVGKTVNSVKWSNATWLWSDFVAKMQEPYHTNESFSEYLKATKAEQLRIKDVGGYVGGYLRGGRRKPQNVVNRQLLTLDLDFAHLDFWDNFQFQYENAAILHATHKFHPDSPRYRLIIPLDREVTPDEYVAIARKVAGLLDIELFDNTTFETNRLMFWPSSPNDIEYYFKTQDGPWLCADEVLSSYLDWTDSSLWPTSQKHTERIKATADKQEDPQTKKGIVGAFCRAYDIEQAIETFLKEEYTSAQEGRYTYTKGTTGGGLVIYDDKFAFSHHGTDPCSGKLCNAFDLVRVHKFGHLDPEESNSTQKSTSAMHEFAREDKTTKGVLAAETLQESRYDFADDIDMPEQDEMDLSWMEDMDIDNKGGKYLPTANNIDLILANDPLMKQRFKRNVFDNKAYVMADLPWRKVRKPEPFRDVDESGIRNYIEVHYGIAAVSKINDSLKLETERSKFHPVKDYLLELAWDGTKRVDDLLVDYFGVERNLYTSEAIRKTLCGAVARIMNPGVKFDIALILVGNQAIGKSSFFRKLGGKWFSDTFMTVHGKEAFEQIQGAWIVEMAELSGLRKAEVEAVKHYLTKQEDMYRPAFGKNIETYPRQCIFVGTTNSKYFLRDPSGNRRFLPIDTCPENAMLSVIDDLDQAEVDQIWAEAVQLYKKGEPLVLSREAAKVAGIEQAKHSEVDERAGLIEEYLNTKLPTDWHELDLLDRRSFLQDPFSTEGKDTREFVCIAEIWCECLGKQKQDMDKYKTRELNDILRGLPEWESVTSPRKFGFYGKQKYYRRRKENI